MASTLLGLLAVPVEPNHQSTACGITGVQATRTHWSGTVDNALPRT
eukprot:CAMPEP_0204120508 /NCGR_PEP_ID=MMETSP0361-20130328/7694_1 /ASSEMBLY_ACC=CAM_ASM_000343 /TAXON_ID=268821 /ORGANISM="Scrippsiella Hangoei, Strain SHTV-5" /LENGTH=45 /DNA_ID= /DNA_START= /DNA_END= /DNA_ORIENTATION=